MYRRDLITAEIQKLAHVLARIIGLKAEGKVAEAGIDLAHALEENFGYLPETDGWDEESFREWLQQQDFPAGVLDSLAAFLYEYFFLQANQLVIARHILVIYDDLEQKHHTQTLQNLERRAILEQHLS